MKKFRLLTLLILAFTCIGFASCSDDDDFDSNNLFGVWEQTWSEGHIKYADNPEMNDEWNSLPDEDNIMTFNTNGTGNLNGEAFTWKLDGRELQLSTGGQIGKATIKSLTAATLIMETTVDGIDEDNGPYKMYDIATFVKRRQK